MKIQFFTQRKMLFVLALLMTALSNTAMEKEPMPSLTPGKKSKKVYSITNHSGQPLHVRVRINDKIYFPYAEKYIFDILGNSEVFLLNTNQALFIPEADLITEAGEHKKFPLNIRIWPGSYEPKIAIDEQGRNLPTPKEDTDKSMTAIVAQDIAALAAQAGAHGDIELLPSKFPNHIVVQASTTTPSYETSKNVPLLAPKQPIKPAQFVPVIPAIRPVYKPEIPAIMAKIPAIKPADIPDIPAIKPYFVKPQLGIPKNPPAAQYIPYKPNVQQADVIAKEEAMQLTEQNGYLTENLQPSEIAGFNIMEQKHSRYTLLRNSFGPLYARIELGKYVFKPLNFNWDSNHNVFLFEKGKDLLFDSLLLKKYGPFKIYLWPKERLDFISKNVDATGKPIPTTLEDEQLAAGVHKSNNINTLRGSTNAFDLINDYGILLFKELNIE